jgi:hypothetical protein
MNAIARAACSALLLVAVVSCTPASSDADSEYAALDVCHQRIEDQLKAPATADYTDEVTTESAPGNWNITGAVDAENSFGAKIRASYVCIAIHKGGDNWSVNATIIPQ